MDLVDHDLNAHLDAEEAHEALWDSRKDTLIPAAREKVLSSKAGVSAISDALSDLSSTDIEKIAMRLQTGDLLEIGRILARHIESYIAEPIEEKAKAMLRSEKGL